MKISTRGRYALRIMIDLAEHTEEGYISLNEIAIRQEISVKYLEQIIAILNKAHLVESARGNNGGYRLCRKPKEYKVGEILKISEGDLSPIDCINGQCERKENCKTFDFWKGLDKTIEGYVNSKTLQDLLNN